MSYDAIDGLAGREYSEREAAFLYMVAIHSGYFLRRQFNKFIVRERGAIATHFLRRAVKLGHVVEMPSDDGRIIYHLTDKQVYGMVSHRDSQGRRIKSSGEILRRLMALDYVLLHLDRERFVETKDARHQLFTQLKVSPEAVKRAEAFGRVTPISLAESAESQIVRLAFLDEGQRSTSMFARFLRTYTELLRTLPRAEVAYVSVSPAQFSVAQKVFERHMPLRNSAHPACPLGVEHLVRWLDVRYKFHEKGSSIDPSEHRLLLEGERIYSAPVHQGLIASWNNGAMNPQKVRVLFQQELHRVSFATELLETDYPRSVDLGPGYTPGYDDPQKCLFSKDIEQEEQGKTCN